MLDTKDNSEYFKSQNNSNDFWTGFGWRIHNFMSADDFLS